MAFVKYNGRGIQINQFRGILLIPFEGAASASMALAATAAASGDQREQRTISALNPPPTGGPAAAGNRLRGIIVIPFCPHRGRDGDGHATPLAIHMKLGRFRGPGISAIGLSLGWHFFCESEKTKRDDLQRYHT